jgi:FkbM family methyltransferase
MSILAEKYLLSILEQEVEKYKINGEVFVENKSKIEYLLKKRGFQNIINKISTHKFRQTLMYYLKFNKNYYPQYTEKMFALDFLCYVIIKNPIIPLNYFSKKDKPEIMRFVKNKYLVALLQEILTEDVFTSLDFEKQKEYINFTKKIKFNIFKGQYNIDGFITKKIDFAPNVFLYRYGLDKLRDQKKYKNSTILDCGAYDGDSAWQLYNDLKPDKVYSFEPEKANFERLKENITINNLTHVIPLNLGVSNRRGFAFIKSEGGKSTFAATGDKVKIDTIDNICKKMKISNVSLIKMDIEGNEFDAIIGAKKVIQTYKPTLLVSVYHTGKDFFEIPKLIKKMVPTYKLRFLNQDNEKATLERIILADF